MANTPTVYVICDKNCKFEGMTKEQIYTAIAQAVNEGTISDIDTGFIQTVKTINGTPLKFFVGTQHEYDILSAADKENLFAIITNDATRESILAAVESLQETVESLLVRVEGMEAGTVTVKNASKAIHDANGNVITETYGNFDKAWQSASREYPKLTNHGTYQIMVRIAVDDTLFTNKVIYWGGGDTEVLLNIAFRESAHIFIYRLLITADGNTSVQTRHINLADNYVSAWTEYDYYNSFSGTNNVSIYYRQIL